MARTGCRFIHCWAPFLVFDQKYLCTPSPIVETIFYTGTQPLHDKFLTLQETPLSCSLFSQAFCCMKGSKANCKKYKFREKERALWKLRHYPKCCWIDFKLFPGCKPGKPEQFDLNLCEASLLCALVLLIWMFIIGSLVTSWLYSTNSLLHQSFSDNNW